MAPTPEMLAAFEAMGKFTEERVQAAGFSIREIKDMGEAVAWAKRVPNAMPGRSVIELRPFYVAADLADFVTPEELATPRDGARQARRRLRLPVKILSPGSAMT